METQLAQMRVDYRRDELDVGDLDGTWHEQLARWLADATAAGVVEPNAMVLATAGDDCTPSSRTVLCKDVDERGVVFYTNYTSAKSHELRSIRRAAATFPWYAHPAAGEPARRRRAGRPGGDPRLLGDAAAGLAAGRVGVGAVDLRARPRRPRRRPRGHRAPLRRHRRGAGAAALGRLADRPGPRRVLAGPGRTGCTTGCGSSRTPSTGRGRSAGSPPDPRRIAQGAAVAAGW